MSNNTLIKINNEFKQIVYKFNGENDFKYNIFNNETFEHDEVHDGSLSLFED